MSDFVSDEDFKAAAELAMENPNCTVVTVAQVIRDSFGWRSAAQARDEALFALRLVGNQRSKEISELHKERSSG